MANPLCCPASPAGLGVRGGGAEGVKGPSGFASLTKRSEYFFYICNRSNLTWNEDFVVFSFKEKSS